MDERKEGRRGEEPRKRGDDMKGMERRCKELRAGEMRKERKEKREEKEARKGEEDSIHHGTIHWMWALYQIFI